MEKASGSHVRQQERGEFGALDLPQVLELYYKNGHSIMPALALIFPNAPGTLLLMTRTSVSFLSSFQPQRGTGGFSHWIFTVISTTGREETIISISQMEKLRFQKTCQSKDI